MLEKLIDVPEAEVSDSLSLYCAILDIIYSTEDLIRAMEHRLTSLIKHTL